MEESTGNTSGSANEGTGDKSTQETTDGKEEGDDLHGDIVQDGGDNSRARRKLHEEVGWVDDNGAVDITDNGVWEGKEVDSAGAAEAKRTESTGIEADQ